MFNVLRRFFLDDKMFFRTLKNTKKKKMAKWRTSGFKYREIITPEQIYVEYLFEVK